jgi:predicted nucleic acid-binding protein
MKVSPLALLTCPTIRRRALTRAGGNSIGRKPMNVDREFVDTNVWIYYYSSTETAKCRLAHEYLRGADCVVSTQVVNEFCNVCLKKMRLPIAEINRRVMHIYERCHVVMVDRETVRKALDIRERYGFSYYDCLMVASALAADCAALYTEDLSDGLTINQTKIINIFRGA